MGGVEAVLDMSGRVGARAGASFGDGTGVFCFQNRQIWNEGPMKGALAVEG